MSGLLAHWGRGTLLGGLRTSVTPRRYGYIVLIPEIGEEAANGDNPLLQSDGLPEFNKFTIEKCINAICTQTVALEEGVKNIENSKTPINNIFTDIFTPLEHLESPLELTWGVSKTLYLGNSSMMPTKTYIQVNDKAHRGRVSKFSSKIIYKAVLEAQKDTNLSEEEKRLLKKYEIETRLNGINIEPKKKPQFESNLQVLSEQLKIFRDKNAISLKQFNHTITNPEIVKNFPPNLLKNMAADPNEPNRGPWKVTHHPSVYDGFMEYCPNKTLRWNAWQSYIRMSSLHADRSLESSTTLEKIRTHRKIIANMLGFETFADMSMETKMAGSVKNVNSFINTLLERARPMQNVELEKLQDFASDNGLKGNLEHCDIPFWKREQRRELYLYDEEEFRDYFPLPVVLQGLMELCSTLFEINIVERPKVNAWHEDVKFYDIFSNGSSIPIAGFYFDPYARKEEKIGIENDSGWVVTIRNRSTIAGTQPLAALIFNFQVPIYGKPSLLSFRDVNSLFYRFGYALRHLLTEANYADVAGLSIIEWDASHIGGHVMTNWLYEPHVIKSISSHYANQEPLPEQIINNISNVRQHMAGYDLCKELYNCSLDMELYSTKKFWREIVMQSWDKYHAIPFDKYDAHPCSFSKIVSEQWAAAYFCELWARMLAADIYGAFHEVRTEEQKVLEVGRRYRDTFLASGGTCHPGEVFRRFRGRDSSHKALLYILGLKKESTDQLPKE